MSHAHIPATQTSRTVKLTRRSTLSRTSKSSSWLIMSATGHSTVGLDQAEGFTIVLTSSQLSDQEKHEVAETSLELDPSNTEEKWQSNGLQQFLVFQMSDTLQGL